MTCPGCQREQTPDALGLCPNCGARLAEPPPESVATRQVRAPGGSSRGLLLGAGALGLLLVAGLGLVWLKDFRAESAERARCAKVCPGGVLERKRHPPNYFPLQSTNGPEEEWVLLSSQPDQRVEGCLCRIDTYRFQYR